MFISFFLLGAITAIIYVTRLLCIKEQSSSAVKMLFASFTTSPSVEIYYSLI